MGTYEESFRAYLRSEIDRTGTRYDTSAEKVFALLRGLNSSPAPDLACAVQTLSEDLRLYSGAIRRMTSYLSAHV